CGFVCLWHCYITLPSPVKSSPSPSHEQRAEAEAPDPEPEDCGRDGDHDRRPACHHCRHRDPDEEDREKEKEHAENATLRRGGHQRDSTGPKARDYNRSATQGRSSTGRAPVSKTGGCRF